MAYIKSNEKTYHEIGDTVVTTLVHESMAGKFKVGSKVTVCGKSDRGYDIQDSEGNRVTEIGWII